MDTYGQTAFTTAKVLVNRAIYGLVRTVATQPREGWLHSRWHWYKSPFSLRNQVLWSAPLQAWFRPHDESAMECMLHLPAYEPVSWVAPKPGDVFLDVGAYVGWYTIQAAKAVGSSGRVIALEPDTQNRLQLEENLALNSLPECTVVPVAAWFEAAEIGWRADGVPVWSKVDQTRAGSVRAVTIDSLVSDLGLTNVNWIKMDIEGAEIEALRGAETVLSRFRPVLFIEIHETLDAVSRFLTKAGYVIEKSEFDEPPDRHGWILARPRV
jgi:FkbM family methyltransferase